jgi:CRP-like cAMP-binding protein
MVGHLSYLLLVISMLMRSMTALRLLVIGSALAAITYDVVWLKDPVGVFWETLLVTVNVVQIGLLWRANRRARFSPEEDAFVSSRLSRLSRKAARRLLNRGVWSDGLPGTVLTTEGETVQHLVYLHSGRVDITLNGVTVGTCRPGNYVGEMSVLDGAPASATAVVAEPSRYWLISTETLRKLHETDDELAGAVEMGIARDLRRKIVDANMSASQQA